MYDYNNPEADADCYVLTGETMLIGKEGMEDLGYPKSTWDGNEEYLVYKLGWKMGGALKIGDILERYPEVKDGRPLYAYFEEVE